MTPERAKEVIANATQTVDDCLHENARLRRQIKDAEFALAIWDSDHDSEYWLSYHPETKTTKEPSP